MKLNIALFQNKHGSKCIYSCEEDGTCWADEKKGYVRLSPAKEVEFSELSAADLFSSRIAMLDNEEDLLMEKIQLLRDKRYGLLHPQEEVEVPA